MHPDTRPLLSRQRFIEFLITMIVLTALGVAAFLIKPDAGLVAAVATPITTFATAALGFGNWRDKGLHGSGGPASDPWPAPTPDPAPVAPPKPISPGQTSVKSP